MSRPRTISPQHALSLVWSGLTVAEVARELGCSRVAVYNALKAARLLELGALPRHLVPTFPAGPLLPRSRCNHDVRPIKLGSSLYCPICHQTGWDWHPLFRGVKPLPKDRKPAGKPAAKPTRKQRRAALKAAAQRTVGV